MKKCRTHRACVCVVVREFIFLSFELLWWADMVYTAFFLFFTHSNKCVHVCVCVCVAATHTLWWDYGKNADPFLFFKIFEENVFQMFFQNLSISFKCLSLMFYYLLFTFSKNSLGALKVVFSSVLAHSALNLCTKSCPEFVFYSKDQSL